MNYVYQEYPKWVGEVLVKNKEEEMEVIENASKDKEAKEAHVCSGSQQGDVEENRDIPESGQGVLQGQTEEVKPKRAYKKRVN